MIDLLMVTIAIGLGIYLTRKDIFVSNFKLRRIRVLGLTMEIKAKEKSRPPHYLNNII
ncbi:hypothetical protein [Defluviitalea raffinosedens]|uniref:hypothetical protein n=1 Tax=Defluviitalea raffinosedens TaxID=1450156 RepID=UPI00195EFB85|nr:hypothetical protein [Defluviitalea raffinosedens]MBM7685020.1 hypothetical protein [Defluviitalea raffinosedens]